ncbi:MAG: hypothetical protein KDI13_00895 [Alphaproteobacteria bacterium]|nr:hypothetical protein [Alphaproteobacteria bacterium]
MAFEIKTDENGDKYLEDRENDIIFRRNDVTGRTDEWIERGFDLIWKGQECRVLAHEKNMSSHLELRDWEVAFDFLPSELASKSEELKKALILAFKIYGFDYNPEFRTRDVNINYSGGTVP